MHFIFAVIFIISSLQGFSQLPDFRLSFNINNGLSDNRVYSIVQDDQGFIWIGTHNGLNRFDGKRFTVFNTSNSSLKGNTIWQMKKGPPNYLVLATRYGAAIVDTRTSIIRNIFAPSDPELAVYANNVRHIEFTKKNELILGTQNGIYVTDWNGNILAKLEAEYSIGDIGIRRLHFSFGITCFSNGDALILTESGYCYYNFELKNIVKVQSLSDKSGLLRDFLQAHKESYVFEINNKDQLFYIDHRAFIDSLYIVDLKRGKVIAHRLPFVVKNNIRWDSKIQFHSDSLLTITTALEGFFSFRYNSADASLRLLSGRTRADVFCQYLLQDVENNYWLGTETGIYYGNNQRESIENISILPYVESKGYHPVTAVLVHHNKIWIGGYSGNSGLIVLDKEFQFLRRIDLFKNKIDKNFILSISPWSADTLLIGTKFGAFFLDCRTYTYGPFRVRFSNDAHTAIIIQNYFQSSSGETWLSGGQTGGVWKINKSRDSLYHFRPGKTETEYPMRNAGAFAEDRNGNIWAVHWVDGLARWNRQKKAFDSLVRKWPENALNGFDCSGISIDSSNNFWFFINSYGLVKFDMSENSIRKYVTTSDQADDNTSSLLLTGDSLIWINLRHSILVYNIRTGALSSFSSKNGLPPSENSLQKLEYDYETSMVISGFSNYISLIPLDVIAGNSYRKKVYITRVQVLKTNQAVDYTSQLILPSHMNDLRIDFSVPDYDYNLPHSDFEYRLGPGEPWVSTGSANSLNLNNLRFGQYTLQIRQAGMNQLDTDLAATLAIRIKPAYYQTVWFYLVLATLLCSLLYCLFRFRIQQLKKIHVIRERIASDLHDDLGSRLTNIRVLSLIGESETSTQDDRKKYLKKISEEAHASGEALGEIVFNMKTHDEELEDIAARMRRYAGQVFDGSSSRFKMKIDEAISTIELELEKKRDIFMVFKEILNNIHKHAEAKNIIVELKVSGKKLLMEIADDGKGFDTSEFYGKYGIANMKTRIKKWGGDLSIKSVNGKGTTIIVTLSFQKVSPIKRIFNG